MAMQGRGLYLCPYCSLFSTSVVQEGCPLPGRWPGLILRRTASATALPPPPNSCFTYAGQAERERDCWRAGSAHPPERAKEPSHACPSE